MILALLAVAAALQGGEINIPIKTETWKAQTRDGFAVVSCDRGNCLSIGPWRDGPSGRFEYTSTFPVTAGKLRGWYRTSDLLPRQAAVTVMFDGGGKRLSSRSFPLAHSPAWARFEAPVFRPPTGADSVRIAVGLAEKTEGRVLFAGLSLTTEAFAAAFPAEPGALRRPAPPRDFKPGKYFRVEQRQGAWWLVTPEGRPFFSIGTDPRPFQPAKVENQREVRGHMARLGFNSLAAWHNLARWAAFNGVLASEKTQPLIQFRALQTQTADPPYDTVKNAQGLNPGQQQAQAAQKGGFNHAFPDPFDPRWEPAFRAQVRASVELVRDRPYFAAWFADNEREHRELHRYVYSPNCARAFRNFLAGRYGAAAKLAKAWGKAYESFDDVIREKPDPVSRAGAMYEDFHLFRREMLRRFNATVLRVIREEDPGRLVFTNRFMIGEGRDLIENLDLYRDFDGVAVNIYPANISAGLAPEERAVLELIHQRTGKPVLIGEWSVPALDSGLYGNPEKLDWSYPNAVDTQQQRARQAAKVTVDLYNLPFVVGAHWFIWTDFDSPVRQANRGLFKVSGEPWTELQQALQGVHARIVRAMGGR